MLADCSKLTALAWTKVGFEGDETLKAAIHRFTVGGQTRCTRRTMDDSPRCFSADRIGGTEARNDLRERCPLIRSNPAGLTESRFRPTAYPLSLGRRWRFDRPAAKQRAESWLLFIYWRDAKSAQAMRALPLISSLPLLYFIMLYPYLPSSSSPSRSDKRLLLCRRRSPRHWLSKKAARQGANEVTKARRMSARGQGQAHKLVVVR